MKTQKVIKIWLDADGPGNDHDEIAKVVRTVADKIEDGLWTAFDEDYKGDYSKYRYEYELRDENDSINKI